MESNLESEFSVGAKTAIDEAYGGDDVIAPVVARRRSGSVKRNKDGTIIKGKRKQLGTVEKSSKPVIAKKVAAKKKAVKTRRVVTGQTEQQVMDNALDRITHTDDYQQN